MSIEKHTLYRGYDIIYNLDDGKYHMAITPFRGGDPIVISETAGTYPEHVMDMVDKRRRNLVAMGMPPVSGE